MTSNEIRSSFLKFFERERHRVVPSSPLVPADDPTLLFTNAGMNQFKDVFLGCEKREYTRATTSQKVMRVSGKHNDLDNVGPSHTHHTFFQMLGNFSFGDYFKREAIGFAWTLLTEVWKLPPDRLMPSIFKGEGGIPRDDEAYEIWKRFVPADRIVEFGLEDNFWQMGDTGPCGRCSEIYYTREPGGPPKVEIWNLVFMEFERGADGALTPLPAPSIDTGMGFERVAAVLQNKPSNYDTDQFQPLIVRLGELAGVKYGASERSDVSMRVVADHIRATTFLIGDGVFPSNEWRGYVLRKIMRRAMRHGKHLGFTEPFLHTLVGTLDREMGGAYPEIRRNRETIERTILAEEDRFEAVLNQGLPRLENEIARALDTPDRILSGEAAFRLYDTFGVPYDFIEDTAATQDVRVDRAGFEIAMGAQREKARAGSTFGARIKGADLDWRLSETTTVGLDELGDQFEGYARTKVAGTQVVALLSEIGAEVDSLAAGARGYVALKSSPFYVEAGGQVSDTGRIYGPAGEATVTGVFKVSRSGANWPRFHRVTVESGTLNVRDIVTAEVDAATRDATRRNHTATHLLHAALRQVLGAHVKQAGSLVAPDRLRFDFVHFQPVSIEERERIERIVNAEIVRNVPVQTETRSTEEAIAAGAMALFGEKYGDTVRVVSVPGFSMELCGGTHVSATGDIGFFVIVAESGVAAGVRRIEALTGSGAVEWAQQERGALERVVDALHVGRDQAVEAIERLQADVKRLGREVAQLKTKVAMSGGGQKAAYEEVDVSGVKFAYTSTHDLEKDQIRDIADSIKASIGTGVVLVANSSPQGTATLVVSVTPQLTKQVSAGKLIGALAPIVDGRGGGRPDFAEAGGKAPEKIQELLRRAPAVLQQILQK
jgi:alanyl-tRNA synthetase